MKNWYNKIWCGLFVGCFLVCMGAPWHTADAAAWWGEGYKTPEWVLKHGGTIIHYHIVNTNHADKYKAMMFQNGKYVEVEFGNNEHFDDAINGTYTINFYTSEV